MHKAILGICGNTGNKRSNFNKVYELVIHNLGPIVISSAIYQSPPWGFQSDNDFWNQILVVETTLTPQALLREIHLIEQIFGRKRESKGYLSRDMDIDILFYDHEIILGKELIIPHPLIGERRFVLVPLAEILPEMVHPVFKKSIVNLLNECSDNSLIYRIS